jgi:hypothetical protein
LTQACTENGFTIKHVKDRGFVFRAELHLMGHRAIELYARRLHIKVVTVHLSHQAHPTQTETCNAYASPINGYSGT